MSRRLRKGDLVTVISGDDRGKRGRILRIYPQESRVIVEGVNLVYKHLRRSQKNPQGGRIRREAALHMSNVMPVDPESNQRSRIRMVTEGGRRVRVAVRSGASLDAETKGKKSGDSDSAVTGKSED